MSEKRCRPRVIRHMLYKAYTLQQYWIYKNDICELRINIIKTVILAVCFQLKQLQKQPQKIQDCTGSSPFKPEFF